MVKIQKPALRNLQQQQIVKQQQDPAVQIDSAKVERKPLRALDAMDEAARTDQVGRVPERTELAAVQTMRDLVFKTDKLEDYYKAVTGEVDNPAQRQDAMKLFESLPRISPETSAAELEALGLWAAAPRGVEEALSTPRYQAGRDVLVETTVNADPDSPEFLSYQEGGEPAVTHKAKLVGQEGDDFLVQVEGRAEPLRVPKAEVFARNQAHQLEGDGTRRIGGVKVDYDDPLLKAKLTEAALKMDKLVGELDLNKQQTEAASGQLVRFAPAKQARPMRQVQADCLKAIHDVIDMKFPSSQTFREPGRSHGSDVGRLAVRGLGVDYEQLQVFNALLAPFADKLGVETRVIYGGMYRGTEKHQNPFRSQAPHVWNQVTYLPSLEQSVCDPTWSQIDHPMDKAYSKWGDRYPRDTNWIRLQKKPVADGDIDL